MSYADGYSGRKKGGKKGTFKMNEQDPSKCKKNKSKDKRARREPCELLEYRPELTIEENEAIANSRSSRDDEEEDEEIVVRVAPQRNRPTMKEFDKWVDQSKDEG